MCACDMWGHVNLFLDLACNVPEAGVLRWLPPGALHCGRKRLWLRLGFASQGAHLCPGHPGDFERSPQVFLSLEKPCLFKINCFRRSSHCKGVLDNFGDTCQRKSE